MGNRHVQDILLSVTLLNEDVFGSSLMSFKRLGFLFYDFWQLNCIS